MPHVLPIIFLFLLGACVGSFLNVVIWRLPRGESLSQPGSHCPNCSTPLKWYDNLPIVGWLKLRGRCRFCSVRISPVYPIVETATALLFVFYYVMYFIAGYGPCVQTGLSEAFSPMHPLEIGHDWPIFLLSLYLVAALLAASLIDAKLFLIPASIIWNWQGGIVIVSLIIHTFADKPGQPGALLAGPTGGAIAVGGALGLLLSLFLLRSGWLPYSFAEGLPSLEIEKDLNPQAEPRVYLPREIRAEMRKEMAFLLAPLALAGGAVLLTGMHSPLQPAWTALLRNHTWLSGLLGSILGGLVGGFTVWMTRILGSYAFGKEAMGMGDVDLMAGVGCALGGGVAVVAFFLAPFFGIIIAVYMLLTKARRELPYGPYLSLATAFLMVFYCPIADYLTQGILGLIVIMQHGMAG